MPSRWKELPPIEFSFTTTAMSVQVFRAITSQNELRKWWAPRIAMSHNRVSQRENRDVFMKIIGLEESKYVRYAWRPEYWGPHIPQTTITITLSDIGVSRESTGDGLLLDISHDGWVEEKEKIEQEKIWELAVESLKHLLDKNPRPWWKEQSSTPDWKQVKLQILKPLIETFKKKDKQRQKNKQIYQGLWSLCSSLNTYGKWYLNLQEESFYFSHHDEKIFQISPKDITLFWQGVKGITKPQLQDIKDRLSVEQDLDSGSGINEKETVLSLSSLRFELWISWCRDLLDVIERSKNVKSS